ncbi:MAG: CHASE sensor domain-containing protein [Thermoguttaceae bacterium]|jgi:signal transduction histidine kinase
MRSFKNLSIKTKLNLLVLVSSGAALLLASAVLVFNDARLIGSSKVQQLSALAKVLGANSTAALTFDDPAAARELLSSLNLQPTVQFACLYNAKGQVFAAYQREKQADFRPPSPRGDGHEFTAGNYLDVTQKIIHDGEKVGTIYLHASMEDLNDQLLRYAGVVAIVITVSMGLAIILSSRLQHIISVPILQLAKTAQMVSANRDYSVRVQKYANDELGTLYNEFNDMLGQIEGGEKELQRAHAQLKVRVQQLSNANLDLTKEIAERKRAERELEIAHRQLLDAARRAGMAEVATGVLHNVGNVLNSINVSSTLVADRLRNSRLSELTRALDMLYLHAGDMENFLKENEKGKQLCDFLNLVAPHLDRERKMMLEEMQSLAKNINHIKTIVSMQQSYAGESGVRETVVLTDLIEDALVLNASSFGKYEIELVRDYATMPQIQVEKQKVLQILVNLVRNARDALVESGRKDRRLTLRTGIGGNEKVKKVRIEVIDNGVGIAGKNLTRIFSHGFTTKKHGHGFGLHSSANTAKELGGNLFAHSDGPGRGAVFTLELPFMPAETPIISRQTPVIPAQTPIMPMEAPR